MRKKILLMLSVFCFMGATVFGQAIEGGAGVIHYNGNPNLDTDMDDLSVNEGAMAYDRTTNTAYFFDSGANSYATNNPAPGEQWIAVSIAGLVDPITSIVVTPGDDELTAVTLAGVTTLSFESDATISFDAAANELTFTDLDGDDTTIDVSGGTVVQAADPSITVAGTGTTADPYEVSLTGADGATSGTVPVTNGTGTLTWTDVITGAVIQADGQLELTMTGGTNAKIDLSTIPEVANMGDVTTRIAALGAGESALLKAADLNTFGMPATSGFGVIFVIEKP